jgi:hypothetical protein
MKASLLFSVLVVISIPLNMAAMAASKSQASFVRLLYPGSGFDLVATDEPIIGGNNALLRMWGSDISPSAYICEKTSDYVCLFSDYTIAFAAPKSRLAIGQRWQLRGYDFVIERTLSPEFLGAQRSVEIFQIRADATPETVRRIGHSRYEAFYSPSLGLLGFMSVDSRKIKELDSDQLFAPSVWLSVGTNFGAIAPQGNR